jgi:exopolysaccharide production protein ExoZ
MIASERLSGIQLLRAAAALLIVLYHSGNAITGFADKGNAIALPFVYSRGYYAVDLFFAVSAFIICYVSDTSRFSAASFYFRRFWRIYPIYALFCVAALLWYYAGLPPLGNDPWWKGIIRSMLILPQPPFPIYAVGWSLEFEVLFYLLAGALLPTVGKWGLLAVLLSLALSGWTGLIGKPVDYHVYAPQWLQFGAGIIAYILHQKLPKNVLWWLLVGAGCALYLMPETKFLKLDDYRALVALGSVCLILGWLRFDFRKWPRFERAAVHLGDLTYSTYLCHWIVLIALGMAAALVPSPSLLEPYRFAAIAVVFLVSHFFHIWVELPVLRLGRLIESLSGHSAREAQSVMATKENR